MAISAAIITITPLMWLLSMHAAWSCVVQIVAGVGWAGFNLALNNFLFDAVTPSHRARCTAYLNFFTNTGVLAGGFIAATLAELKPVALGPLHFSHWIIAVFVVSFLLRAGTLALILPRFREVREAPP
jgi:MFS family permease